MTTRHTTQPSGFTIIEMAIVLMIIGLLVGGVLAAQSLVAQSRLSSIIKQSEKFRAAFNGFVAEYGQLPGDFTKAYDYWGVAVGCTNNTGLATSCNGNGDGTINYDQGYENTLAWMHLSRAEYVEGLYNGADAPYVADVNIPSVEFDKSILWDPDAEAKGQMLFGRNTINWLQLKGNWNKGFLSPQDAYSIDKKIDDGLASQGKFFAINDNYSAGNASTCVSGTHTGAYGNSNYQQANTSSLCLIWFQI
jgi:prepilin-type N-terminal cleavage/methylation domain-containing protein